MFDFGFTELVVIGLVALLVVGPERLPRVARTAGHLLGRLQGYVNNVKADLGRQMQLDDLKKLQDEMAQQARELESSVSANMRAAEGQLREAAAPLDNVFSETADEQAWAPALASQPSAHPDADDAVPDDATIKAEQQASADDALPMQLDLGLGSPPEGAWSSSAPPPKG
jgi:sec-independent protein translocase protein TatB